MRHLLAQAFRSLSGHLSEPLWSADSIVPTKDTLNEILAQPHASPRQVALSVASSIRSTPLPCHLQAQLLSLPASEWSMEVLQASMRSLDDNTLFPIRTVLLFLQQWLWRQPDARTALQDATFIWTPILFSCAAQSPSVDSPGHQGSLGKATELCSILILNALNIFRPSLPGTVLPEASPQQQRQTSATAAAPTQAAQPSSALPNNETATKQQHKAPVVTLPMKLEAGAAENTSDSTDTIPAVHLSLPTVSCHKPQDVPLSDVQQPVMSPSRRVSDRGGYAAPYLPVNRITAMDRVAAALAGTGRSPDSHSTTDASSPPATAAAAATIATSPSPQRRSVRPSCSITAAPNAATYSATPCLSAPQILLRAKLMKAASEQLGAAQDDVLAASGVAVNADTEGEVWHSDPAWQQTYDHLVKLTVTDCLFGTPGDDEDAAIPECGDLLGSRSPCTQEEGACAVSVGQWSQFSASVERSAGQPVTDGGVVTPRSVLAPPDFTDTCLSVGRDSEYSQHSTPTYSSGDLLPPPVSPTQDSGLSMMAQPQSALRKQLELRTEPPVFSAGSCALNVVCVVSPKGGKPDFGMVSSN